MAGGFCTLCSHKVESFDGLDCCPNCTHTGVPCGDENQVTISVNIHELRVLCMWAENWAYKISKETESCKSCPDVVYAIARRLSKQLPPDKRFLTFSDELNQIKEAGFKFETNHPADEGNHPIQTDPEAE